MKYHIAFILIFNFFSYNTKAQNDSVLRDSIEDTDYTEKDSRGFAFKRYKWDVATDIGSLLSKPPFVQILQRSSTYSFQLRKNVLESVPNQFAKRKVAYRIRVGAYARFKSSEKADTTITGTQISSWYNSEEQRFISAFLRLGKEWQKQLGRFQLFYGLDLHGSLLFSNYFYDNYMIINKDVILIREEDTFKTFYYGVSSFIGMKFFIHNRISISSEASIYLYKIDDIRKRSLHMLKINSKGSSIGATLSPVSFFSFNYHF